jgi:eukaryotic-like serine/threonine-protein kinase
MSPATDELTEGDEDELDGEKAAQARIGLVVGGTYRITRHVGSGGSSHVFEAEHVRLGKAFAVKLLRAEINLGKKTGQRFRREAKAVARLHSEHIVSVIDCGELDDQTPYVVLELLQGEDLRSLLRREGSLPARRAVQIIVEACRGLSIVHEAGLVHRDLKPENLFIARRSTGQDWCKVLDFGVAKMEASQSTAQGAIVGTVRYMAPEQLANSAAVGPPTDVYALAAILYECLSGKALHEGSSVQEVMYSVMNRQPAALDELRPGLPSALLRAVHGGIAKDPAARPASTEALARMLLVSMSSGQHESVASTLSEEHTEQLAATAARRSPPTTLRWPLVLGLVGLSGLAGAVLARRSDTPEAKPIASNSARTPAPAPSPRVVTGSMAPTPQPSVVTATPPALAAPASASASSLPASPPRASRPASVATPKLAPVATPKPSSKPARATAPGRFDEANPYGE